MLTLGINTCLATADLALVRDSHVLGVETDSRPRGHEATLPVMLETLLNGSGHSLSELDRIAVVTGPGSFTGIRIGVAFARGFALSLKADIVGLTALEAGIDPENRDTVLAVLPAQKRPPDRTWWVQRLENGIGTDSVSETGDLPSSAHIEALPQSRWAALKAHLFSPGHHPPSPVYARQPDAKPMRPALKKT